MVTHIVGLPEVKRKCATVMLTRRVTDIAPSTCKTDINSGRKVCPHRRNTELTYKMTRSYSGLVIRVTFDL